MTQPARRSAPRALSESSILDAALALLDEGGAAAMSIRGIAARVGVAPNAVYTYFPSKYAVEMALVDRTLGELDLATGLGRRRSWKSRLEQVALDLRDHLGRHPGVVTVLLGTPLDGPNALRLLEHLLGLFADAGLSRTAAARAAYVVLTYVVGSLALAVAEVGQHGPLPPEDIRIAERRQVFAAIPAADYPRCAAAVGVLADQISTEQFVWGFRRLLAGLAPR